MEAYEKWLDIYSRASQENDAETSSELFSIDVHDFETPYADPHIGQEAI